MSKRKTLHNNDKGRKTCQQLPDSDSVLYDQLKDGISSEGLSKVKHSYQPFPSRQVGKVHDDVVAMHQVGHVSDYKALDSLHKRRIDHLESSKRYVLQTRKILQILATPPPPSKEFYWIPDIEHFTLHYKNKYTGIIIYVCPDVGTYRILLGEYELISVSTLRQAQAICNTIAWVFKNSLPIRSNYNKRGVM